MIVSSETQPTGWFKCTHPRPHRICLDCGNRIATKFYRNRFGSEYPCCDHCSTGKDEK